MRAQKFFTDDPYSRLILREALRFAHKAYVGNPCGTIAIL